MDLQFLVLLLNVKLFLCSSLAKALSVSLKPGDAEVSAQGACIYNHLSSTYTFLEGRSNTVYM